MVTNAQHNDSARAQLYKETLSETFIWVALFDITPVRCVFVRSNGVTGTICRMFYCYSRPTVNVIALTYNFFVNAVSLSTGYIKKMLCVSFELATVIV